MKAIITSYINQNQTCSINEQHANRTATTMTLWLHVHRLTLSSQIKLLKLLSLQLQGKHSTHFGASTSQLTLSSGLCLARKTCSCMWGCWLIPVKNCTRGIWITCNLRRRDPRVCSGGQQIEPMDVGTKPLLRWSKGCSATQGLPGYAWQSLRPIMCFSLIWEILCWSMRHQSCLPTASWFSIWFAIELGVRCIWACFSVLLGKDHVERAIREREGKTSFEETCDRDLETWGCSRGGI